MSKTRTELVVRALEKLKVVGAGQMATARDTAFVDNLVIPVLEDLRESQVYAWGDTDQIDDAAFEHIADLLADAAASDFVKARMGAGDRQVIEARLRRLSPYGLSGQRLQVEYF